MVYCKCVVKGCTTTSLKKSLALFDVPTSEALFVKWQEKIQTNDGQPLTLSSKVCELHFHSKSIRKEIVSHRNYKNSLRSVLSKNAVPSLNLGPTPVIDNSDDSVTTDPKPSSTVGSDGGQAESSEIPGSVEAVNSSVENFAEESINTESESTNLQKEASTSETIETESTEISDNSQFVIPSESQVDLINNMEVVDQVASDPEEESTLSEQDVRTPVVGKELTTSSQETLITVPEGKPENSTRETMIAVSEEGFTNSPQGITLVLEEEEPENPVEEDHALEEVGPVVTNQSEDVASTTHCVVENEVDVNAVISVAEKEMDASTTHIVAESEADGSVTISLVEPTEGNLKDAAVEAGQLDVLVCGNCHTVFHFIEEFQAHKDAAACNETSSLKSNITEPKPQVWAFLIWKNSQIETSPKIPQNKGAQKSPTKGRIRPYLTLPHKKGAGIAESNEAVNNLRAHLDSEGEIYSSGVEDADVSQRIEAGDEIIGPFQIKEEVLSEEGEESSKIRKLKKPSKPPKSGTTADDEEEETDEEYSVERIVARRYNSKKKEFEYLLKWEGYPPDQNTWEPAENLATCQHLLKAYEENLAKMQQNHKNAKNAVPVVAEKKEPEQGRPIRNSKQKAFDQVKQWCGTMKNDEGKRRFSDSFDSEGPSSYKKMKQEKDETFSSYKPISRNDTARMAVNGVPDKKQVLSRLAAELGIVPDDDLSPTKSSSTKPIVRSISSLSQQNQEVLVASAKGVVKVDPSQVPNLSSGVYIMSNKSGIIKLDSLSPQKALSSLRKTGVLPQTSKGGVVVLQTPTQKGMPRSGIVPKSQVPQRVQEVLPASSKVPVHKSILPKSLLSNSSRPTGILRPSGMSTPRPLRPAIPRMPVSSIRPPPLSKIQFPSLRPRGSQLVGRPPSASKDRMKPIQSILGSALLASEDKAAALRAKTPTSQNITIGPNQTPKFAALKKSTSKISKTQALQGAKFVDNGQILMEFREKSDSDSDYGIEDDFPADLPPIESVENSPPRPLTLDPATGERLMKAEGERTPSPEPTPPPTPPPKTPEPPLSSESTDTTETLDMTGEHSNQGHFIKVEMSPGGTTGMVTETTSASQEALEFTAVGDECSVSGLRVKKILSPTSEIEHQRILSQHQEQVSMEGVESGVMEVEDSIIHVTGEDGTVYQVSSSQLNGDTLLLSEGDEGTQQCVFVTEEGGEGTVLALDPSQYADSVGELAPEQMEILANSNNTITIESGEGEDQAQVVAQLVEAGEPSGGGLRKVVLMLPDGNLMMTEVDEEQFAALELDK